jgi:predicted RNase H-like HicB family nuclease
MQGEGAVDEVLKLTFVIEPEDDRYVATCQELDVASQGTSVEDALQRAQNAVALYLEILEEDGELDGVLRERGLQRETRLATNYRVDVPAGVFATVRSMPLRRLART